MRVIVTGSREYADRDLVGRLLDEVYAVSGSLILVHGACACGADWFADGWAADRQLGPRELNNVLVDRFPANWGSYGRAAGMVRNTAMVNAGAHLVLAFFQPGAANKGTSHCVKLARRAGIEVREYGRENQATTDYEQETLPI